MLYSLIKEMFTSHLQGLPRLAGLQRDGSPHWLPEAENWLEEAENLMGRFRFPEGGRIAIARGNIAKARDMPTGEGQHPRKQIERTIRRAAQEALEEAANLLTDRARTAEDRLQSFRDKLCEGITAYRVQLPADAETVPAPSSLWRGLKGFEPARALLSYVEVSLGKQDIEYILLDICETWAGNFSRSAD